MEVKAANSQMELDDMPQTQTLPLAPCASHSVPFVELRQSFPSQIYAISPFVEQLMSFIAKCRPKDGSEIDIEVALSEALGNAVVHGNRRNPHKRVYVTCRCTVEGNVSIKVQDEGKGFDIGTLLDPIAPENRLRTSGRGVFLMKVLMDEVRFENGGTVVHMCKKSNAGSAFGNHGQ